jgi:hypothetical protein
MKDYSKMTTDELVEELARLELGLEMNLVMDGSGELGDVIGKGYYEDINAIEKELQTRPDNPYKFDGNIDPDDYFTDDLPF